MMLSNVFYEISKSRNSMSNKIQKAIAMAKLVVARILVCFSPIRKDKFFFIAMKGKSYGDNMKCISDYVALHHKNPTIIWSFTKSFIKTSKCNHQMVTNYTLKYYYHLLTSKYIIHNVSFSRWEYKKMKGQIVLNTWHGTPLKKIGIDSEEFPLSEMNHMQFNSDITDIFVSGSKFTSNVYRKALLQKKIFETGTPRNDIFFYNHPNIKKKVRERFQINEYDLILLYAPTFRSDMCISHYDFDINETKRVIENRTGKHVEVLIRLHPKFMSEKNILSFFPPYAIDATSYEDMQELLYATDILVTDYSSSMFDFMYMLKPVIMYVPDREQYERERGTYFRIDELPFIVINNNNEIGSTLESFDISDYKDRVTSFFEKIGSVENGHATKSAYELLCDFR